MFDGLKKMARTSAKWTTGALKTVEPYAKKSRGILAKESRDILHRTAPVAKEALGRAKPLVKQSSAQAQRYTASALKTAQTYINTGKAQQKAQQVATETFLKPTKKVFKRTRNWTIGLGLAAVGIYGFSHGMGTALVGLTKNVSEWNDVGLLETCEGSAFLQRGEENRYYLFCRSSSVEEYR